MKGMAKMEGIGNVEKHKNTDRQTDSIGCITLSGVADSKSSLYTDVLLSGPYSILQQAFVIIGDCSAKFKCEISANVLHVYGNGCSYVLPSPIVKR